MYLSDVPRTIVWKALDYSLYAHHACEPLMGTLDPQTRMQDLVWQPKPLKKRCKALFGTEKRAVGEKREVDSENKTLEDLERTGYSLSPEVLSVEKRRGGRPRVGCI